MMPFLTEPDDDPPWDESDLTQRIAGALSDCLSNAGHVFVPNTRKQALSHFASKEVFADIVARLDSKTVIAIEVKTTDIILREDPAKLSWLSQLLGVSPEQLKITWLPLVLRHYSPLQQKIYGALCACRVPIYYCYNISNRPESGPGSLALLAELIKAAQPDDLLGDHGILQRWRHSSLWSVIQDMVKGRVGRTGVITSMMFPSLAANNVSRMGLRWMLLAYNSDNGHFELYDDGYMSVLNEILHQHVKKDIRDSTWTVTARGSRRER